MKRLGWIICLGFLCFGFSASAQSLIPEDSAIIEDTEVTLTEEEDDDEESYDEEDEPGFADYNDREIEKDDYQQEPLQGKQVDKNKWERYTRGLDYNEKSREEKKKKDLDQRKKGNNSEQDNDAPIDFGKGAQNLLLWFTIALIIALVVYLLRDAWKFKGNALITKNSVADYEIAGTNIFESDLERMLRLALEQGNLKEAVRAYYLMSIRLLAEERYIQLARDKTNREYLYEIVDKPFYQDFRKMTLLFERAWYGDMLIQVAALKDAETWYKQLTRLKGGGRYES